MTGGLSLDAADTCREIEAYLKEVRMAAKKVTCKKCGKPMTAGHTCS